MSLLSICSMMKLTQKTIFQCFDKSERQSPILIDDQDEDIIECEPEIQPSTEQSDIPLCQPDFLLPIHIRQADQSSKNDIIPLFHHWKLTESDDDISSDHQRNFYRIHPINNSNDIDSPKLQFISIPTIERQIELFQQYTNDELSTYGQSIIDWQSMFQYLQDYRKKAIDQNQYEQLPWTEIYRPRHSKTYLGSHTKQIRRLNEWFTYWTKKLHNEKPKKVTRKGRKRGRDYDDNSDEDFIDESNMAYYNRGQSKQEHPQLIFIHGCGTTSLVHALAEEHNFKVTEINGSQSRARAPLLKQLEQVSSHHYLSLKRCSSDTMIPSEDQPKANTSLPVKKKAKNERGTIMSFFNTKKTDQKEEHKEMTSRRRSNSTKKPTIRQSKKKDEQQQPTIADNHLLSSVHVEKASLILFDEIETLTTDDNFWSCLKKLLETAKKPIILTSNSRSNPEDAMFNLSKLGDYEMIHLEPIEPELIYCFLRMILLVEMLEIPALDELITLFQSCSCDIRRSLLTLQFHAQSSPTIPRADTNQIPSKSHRTKPKLQSSRLFDTMYYSYLGEQWTESILKIPFDDLTSKYTSEYKQSHLLLANHSKNDSKRIELYDTFKMFMQEQETDMISNRSAFYLDDRPYIRQICQNEQARAAELFSNRRLRHCLGFRGCSLQWSDFAILSGGLD